MSEEPKQETAVSVRHTPLKRPLTAQQRSFVRHYAATGNATLAARKAGYGDPEHYGSRLLARMAKSGITESFVSRKIKEGLNATYAPQLYKDGELKQPKSPDFATRHKYLDTTLKITGAYAPVKHEVQTKTINIVLNIKTLDGLVDSDAISRQEVQDFIDAEILREGEDGDGRGTQEADEGTRGTAEENAGSEPGGAPGNGAGDGEGAGSGPGEGQGATELQGDGQQDHRGEVRPE